MSSSQEAAADRPPLAHVKACELEDFAHPDLRSVLRTVFAHELGRFGADYPSGAEYRKDWEVAMAVRCLDAFGVLRDDAEVLGVGAGNEPTVFWLTNHVRRVFATDLYLQPGWEESAGAPMMTDPARHWPGPWRPRRLVVQHMDGRRLDYEDASFDGIFSSGSIEHFGERHDVAASLGEMHRVLKPGGILSLSTELRIAGPGPGVPGALLFSPDQLLALLVEHDWTLLSSPSLFVSAATAATEQRYADVAADVARHVARYGEIRFHELRFSHYPCLVLRDGERVWTSVHVALRKS